MEKQLKEIEIPLGAKDSELCGWEYTIPEGMEATIVNNKIVVKKKDSGDEKIRKALIDYFDDANKADENPLQNYGVHTDKAIAWLEKQGEQKSLDDIAKEVIKDKDAAISFLKSCGIMNENGELADEYKIEQCEQNPIWSEEDEDYCLDVNAAVDDYCAEGYAKELHDWLESLKDRVHPQNRWKPSDEQLRELHCVISGCSFETPILVELEEQLKKL